MPSLKISSELELPLDAVTETFAILAKRRAGKSNAAVVMAEEMYDNGLPWVAIDPKGDWWGVRASGDGKSPGLSVLVFGGLHGDVPLEPTAGNLVADLIVDQRLTCVLDVSEMSKADMRRFLTDFASRLYRKNTEPLHVFCEEADEYIPQRVTSGDTRLVGAFESLIKRGGFRGIGITLITQRSASLNKDVLTQIETLIPMRTPSPQDRKAILAWVDVHDYGKEAVAELPSLANGEAWVFSPQWLDTLVKIQFRRRRTFDSGSTPKIGGKPRPPATLAEVDLASIKEAMAETIEKAKADDPKLLRKRIVELERAATKLVISPEPVVERVEIPVLSESELISFGSLLGELYVVHQRVEEVLERLGQAPSTTTVSDKPAAVVRAIRQATSARTQPNEGDVKLSKTERAILAVLVLHGPSTHRQIALLAGYSPKSSTIGASMSKLRKVGYVEDWAPYTATSTGIEWLGEYDPLPTGEELINYWRGRFGSTERAVLDAFIEVYPATTNATEVCEITGYSPTSSTVGASASKLRTAGIVDGWRLSDDFAASAGLS